MALVSRLIKILIHPRDELLTLTSPVTGIAALNVSSPGPACRLELLDGTANDSLTLPQSSQDSIMCSPDFWDGVFGNGGGPWGLDTCVDLTTFDFGVITAAFTAGGFFSALNAGRVIDRSGKKRTAVIGAWLVIAVSGGAAAPAVATQDS
jgi:MFS family permease